MRGLTVLLGGVCAWLAYDEHDPGHLLGLTVLALALAVPAWNRSWQRARARVGDAYLHQVGLGAPFGTLLLRTSNSAEARDRAIRLRTTVPV